MEALREGILRNPATKCWPASCRFTLVPGSLPKGRRSRGPGAACGGPDLSADPGDRFTPVGKTGLRQGAGLEQVSHAWREAFY